jgi:hypothetical protein
MRRIPVPSSVQHPLGLKPFAGRVACLIQRVQHLLRGVAWASHDDVNPRHPLVRLRPSTWRGSPRNIRASLHACRSHQAISIIADQIPTSGRTFLQTLSSNATLYEPLPSLVSLVYRKDRCTLLSQALHYKHTIRTQVPCLSRLTEMHEAEYQPLYWQDVLRE